jgi:predicted MPP superfamily phosphohydrolase
MHNAMLLLNVSDIHFRHPYCNTEMDPDRPYRTRLIQDARDFVQKLGPVDAILVGGDIAFRGAPEEYAAALEWLKELSEQCQCPLERVFVIPGNHDVDRAVITGSASVRNVQAAISNASNREKELREQFADTEAGRSLLAPIAEYNAFAARFNCQVYAPDKLFWHQDLELDECTILRVYGLTSTLLSGARGLDDTQLSLYLSPLQTVLNPADGVVNLVMCHHPPDWFMDRDDVEDAMSGRAAIQLFGHRHRLRLLRDPSYIRFSAAAVNPDRHEVGWEPGYNVIRLTTSKRNGERFLDIEAHLRVWQTNPDMFRPKMAGQNDGVFRHQLRIYGVAPSKPKAVAAAVGDLSPEKTTVASDCAVAAPAEVETTMTDERTRNLVLRFWNLASSERREIATELGLLENEEIRLPEAERYGRALRRAGERNLLGRVADEIEKREKH